MKTTSHGRYKMYSNKANYSDARRNWKLNGGHLAEFETEAEFEAYDNLPHLYWLGADDMEKEGQTIGCINRIYSLRIQEVPFVVSK